MNSGECERDDIANAAAVQNFKVIKKDDTSQAEDWPHLLLSAIGPLSSVAFQLSA